MATPRVSRVSVADELMVSKDKNHTPIDAQMDEAREARHRASLAIASLAALLDDHPNFQGETAS